MSCGPCADLAIRRLGHSAASVADYDLVEFVREVFAIELLGA